MEQTYEPIGTGMFDASTSAQIFVTLPVTLRTACSSIDYATLSIGDTASNIAVTALTLNSQAKGKNYVRIDATVASGGTQYRPVQLRTNNSTSGYVGFSAEL